MQAFSPNSPDLRAQLGAQLDSQLDFLTQLSRHSLDAFAQLGTLNLQAARQLAGDGMELGRALAACTDPLQMVSATMRVAQPAAEHWGSWQGGVIRVLASGGATLARQAGDGGAQAVRGAAYGAAHNAT